jgi:membrane-bound lytic murein transglycosylase F
MIKRILTVAILILLTLTFSCTKKSSENRQKSKKKKEFQNIEVQHDVEDIKKEGVLRALTTYSSTSYFLYRGQPMGYEYELLKRFAEYLGVKLDIVVSNSIDSLCYQLNRGDVDLVAHGLTVTTERKEKVNFTDYLYLSRQVLVQKKPDNYRKMSWRKVEDSLIHDAIELLDDTVSVRNNTSYMARLENLANEMGGIIHIDTLPGDLSTDRIIEMVAEGEIKYTVADDNLASIYASYYPILDIDVPISFSQKLAWAVRKNTPQLEAELNDWLRAFKKETVYYIIYNKYFKNERGFRSRERSDYMSLNKNQISKYDNLIKTYAKEINWDWRLLAALIYQESRFNPKADSWAGANGLMQLMPVTAKRLGVENRIDPDENIEGGTKFLQILWDRFEEVEDSTQRIKFVMAAYNCGYSHVVDAQNLAKEENVNPYVWDENVEEVILKLSYRKYYTNPVVKYGYVRGSETYNYVKDIFESYEHYKQFIN